VSDNQQAVASALTRLRLFGIDLPSTPDLGADPSLAVRLASKALKEHHYVPEPSHLRSVGQHRPDASTPVGLWSEFGAIPMVVTGTYNPYLVALSILVASCASYTALDLSEHVGPARGFARRLWLVAAALTMGGGIWSMHFVGMLAFVMPTPVSYDIGLTTLSLVVAIFVTGGGFYVISRQSAPPLRLVLSGIFMGLGIAGMHYTGMAAMRGHAELSYGPLFVALSLVIAIGASTVALWLAFRTTDLGQKLVAAVVMGLAISGMHYTGMRAAIFTARGPVHEAQVSASLDQTNLALAVAGVTLIILAFASGASLLERNRAEEALREAQAELERVARLTTMGELVASIAHEINQPLTGVVTNGNACLRWLNRDEPDLEEARNALSHIVSDGTRASEVIRGLRALAKKSGPELAKLDINDAIQEVLALTRSELQRRGVVLRTALYATDRPVLGDRVQLQQVLLNLIMNGVEAMSAVTDRPKMLAITSEPVEPGGLLIAVEDTGTGLDPMTVDRIFDPFFTTKPDGLGMGLSICRSIINAHGGRFWASPGALCGTIFRFTVPRVPSSQVRTGGDKWLA
jgi:NO-binding membrane sensor protein with MHYT domain